MKFRTLFSIVFLLSFVSVHAQTSIEQIDEEITQHGIRAHLEFLASDALKGRNTGSQGLEAAAA